MRGHRLFGLTWALKLILWLLVIALLSWKEVQTFKSIHWQWSNFDSSTLLLARTLLVDVGSDQNKTQTDSRLSSSKTPTFVGLTAAQLNHSLTDKDSNSVASAKKPIRKYNSSAISVEECKDDNNNQ